MKLESSPAIEDSSIVKESSTVGVSQTVNSNLIVETSRTSDQEGSPTVTANLSVEQDPATSSPGVYYLLYL